MLGQLASWYRKLSLAVIGVGLLIAFFTEVFADVPVGRSGRPKPPIGVQRIEYLLMLGAGVPGVAWGVVRAARGQQRTPWE
jgi:hypothetical protein